jgi:hypothetical protein
MDIFDRSAYRAFDLCQSAKSIDRTKRTPYFGNSTAHNINAKNLTQSAAQAKVQMEAAKPSGALAAGSIRHEMTRNN